METELIKKSSPKKKEKKNIVILGENMLKHLKGYDMSKKVGDCKVFVRSFSGTKLRCIKEHTKLTMREKLDHVILHIGTHYFSIEKEPEFISKSIVDLVCTLKSNFVDVGISNIIVRKDKYSDKCIAVNYHLTRFCIEKTIFFI